MDAVVWRAKARLKVVGSSGCGLTGECLNLQGGSPGHEIWRAPTHARPSFHVQVRRRQKLENSI